MIETIIINLIIALVTAGVSMLIQSMREQDKKQVAGVRSTIQTGGDHPLAFIMGFYATAGHLKYAGSWGIDGETPNAYLSKVITVSDLPVRGYAGWFVNGERVTLAGAPTGDLGYAVLEYRVSGKDHLWINTYTGGQTVADPLMRSKFGSDPDRPYTADMIGRGQAYFVATALQNRELFANLPDFLAEVNGISLDDPRGDDAHDNPIVGIRTVLKGIHFAGAWVYGPQSIANTRLPSDNWEGQMDKCDAIVDGQKRFRFGIEVRVDQEPHAVIGELLKACEGRIAEVGGIYKVLVAEPDAPVVSITDEDIVITEGQTLDPFPGLEATFNGITATYPEPIEAWESKEAPHRYRSDLEAADDNRRLPFSTSYKAVPFPVQVQALMRAAIEETRRFRRHTKTMPPEWWEYEPLDAYAWTSERHGYENKLFLISAMDDLPNGSQFVGAQEIDPEDYGWSSDCELPWDVVPLVVARPAPQPMAGFAVSPYVIVDSASSPRRPAILAEFAGGLQDVRAVRIQASLDGDIVFDGETPYDIAEATPSRVLSGAWCVSDEEYQVAGKLLPFSGRETEWSSWLTVTTPTVGLGSEDLSAQVRGNLKWLAESHAHTRQMLEEAVLRMQDGAWGTEETFRQLRQHLSVQHDTDRAYFDERVTLLLGPLSGLAEQVTELGVVVNDPDTGVTATATSLAATQLLVYDGDDGLVAQGVRIDSLDVAVGSASAGGRFMMDAMVSPGGGWQRIGMRSYYTDGVTLAQAVLYLDTKSDGSGRGVFAGDAFYFADAGGTVYSMFEASGSYFNRARIKDLDATNITATKINAQLILQNGTTIEALIATAAVTDPLIAYVPGTFASGVGAFQTLATMNLPGGNYAVPVGAYLDWTVQSGAAGQVYTVELILGIAGTDIILDDWVSGTIGSLTRSRVPLSAVVPPLPAGVYPLTMRFKTSVGPNTHTAHSGSSVSANLVKK